MRYETVIGLEVHVELATDSKIFCSCANRSGDEQNSHVCPACCGMPGMLPIVNKIWASPQVACSIATSTA